MVPTAFRVGIVDPALDAIGLYSLSASVLLAATAVQESGLQNIPQRGGPALGYFQIEPATHDDIWANYLRYRPDLAAKVRALAAPQPASSRTLIDRPLYAAAIARLKYLRISAPLPAPDDIAGMAAMWKAHYNSPLGAGTAAEFIAHWDAAVRAENALASNV